MKVLCIVAIVLTLGIVANALPPSVLASLAGGGASTDDIKKPVEGAAAELSKDTATVAEGLEKKAESLRRRRDVEGTGCADKKEDTHQRRRRDEVVKEDVAKVEEAAVVSKDTETASVSADAEKKEDVHRRRRRDVEETVNTETAKVEDAASKAEETGSADADAKVTA